MTSHASSAQAAGVKGGQEGANVIALCLRKALPAVQQKPVKMDKVTLVIRDAVGGQTLFHTCVIKIVTEIE
jgi:hypothetical protein